MGMLVAKNHLRFWYEKLAICSIINDGKVERCLKNQVSITFQMMMTLMRVSTPENVMKYLNEYEELV